MKEIDKYIIVDKDILSGQPVFKGTRVPVVTLFNHLEKGISLNEFLDDFPSVEKQQAIAVLEMVETLFTPENFFKLNETTA